MPWLRTRNSSSTRRIAGCRWIGSAALAGSCGGRCGARICRRCNAYSRAYCHAASACPKPCKPTCRRAEFIITNIAVKPPWVSPSSQPRAWSKCRAQVALPLIPSLCSIPSHRTPLRSPCSSHLGTSISDRPRLPAGAPGKRTSTRCRMLRVKSCSPPEMNSLLPLML
ncbi:hypothetical protein D3C77_479760 [compost metagenome]